MSEKHFTDPEQYFGHLAYRLAHSDSYMMGPLAQLKRIERQKLEVAARLVSGGIEFNFEKLQGMGADDATMQVKGLIVHQALLHMERRRMLSGGLQQYEAAADLAAELATFHKLEHDRWKVSDKFPKPAHFNLPEHLSMEEYFKLIIDQAEKKGVDLNQIGQPQGGQGQGQGDGEGGEQEGEGQEQGQDQGQEEGGGQGQSPAQQLAEALGSKHEYHKQDHNSWNQVSKVQQEAIQATLPDRLESWMKSRGTEAAGLLRLIEEIRKTAQEKWYQKIRNLVGNRMATQKYRYSIKRPSRRFGVPNAGRIHIRKGGLAVAIDTSGSVSPTELDIFISKLHQIAKAHEAPFEVIICDAAIHCTKMIKRKKDISSVELKGGGGTSSLPVFKHLEGKKIDLMVYLTDLEIDFPDPPPKYHVIWGVINPRIKFVDEANKAPFGETHLLTVDSEPDVPGSQRRRK